MYLNWINLNTLRNNAAHGNGYQIKSDDLLSLLDFIIFIINDENLNEKNLTNALIDKIDTDKLKNKFNYKK